MLFSVVLAGLCPCQEAAVVGLALTGAQGWHPLLFHLLPVSGSIL